MTVAATPPATFGARLWLAFKVFLRAVALLVIFVAIVYVGLFLLVPAAYRGVFLPIQTQRSQIDTLQNTQAQSRLELETQLSALNARIAALELTNAANAEELTTLQSDLSTVRAEAQQFQNALNTLDADLQALTESLTALEVRLQQINAAQSEQAAVITGIQQALIDQNAPAAMAWREVQLLKVMQVILRSRLALERGNAGNADDEIARARALLQTLQTNLPVNQSQMLNKVLRRLELAQENLPDFPVLAAEDLEIAWQLLLNGLPQSAVPINATVITGTLPMSVSEPVTVTLPITP